MNVIVHNSVALKGQVNIPGSKSQSIRAIFFALLSKGESVLTNSLDSDDTQNAIDVCQNLSANITRLDNKLIIKSPGLPLKINKKIINTGNSGITTRFLLPLIGLRENATQPIIIDCGEQMRARSVQPLVSALNRLGMHIRYLNKESFLPIEISGNLIGGISDVDGIASQYISALLIALPCAKNNSEITVNNLRDRPYMDMTLNWLDQQNIEYQHQVKNNEDVFKIKSNQHYHSFQKNISGDFSSASYLIAAAALTNSQVELNGLDMQDPQGDKRLVTILQKMGANIIIEKNRLLIEGGKKLTGIKIDADDIPDLLPTLAVIGTQASGKTEIYNVAQARLKETDRIHSMTDGLKKMQAKIDELENGMIIHQSNLQGAQVKGYGDHRTVMALSIAGLFAEGTTIVEDSEAINKTFPSFINLMQSLGAKNGSPMKIFIIGPMGSGKSTVAKLLADYFNKPFYDIDNIIEKKEKKLISAIFAEHGETYFRELESKILAELIEYPEGILSTGGGVILDQKNRELLQKQPLVIYLETSASTQLSRIGKETNRPLLNVSVDDKLEKLKALNAIREPLYKAVAKIIINTDDLSAEEVLMKIEEKLSYPQQQ